jgi:anaerobic ribonucleoside-triphosphate reductase
MAYSLQGLNNYISSEISKIYWLNKIYPPEIRLAHTDGDFHIHDLGILSVYCVGWDLEDLLMQGFKGAMGKVESKPARHMASALGQIVNFFYTLQGEAAGAQAFSHFDTFMAPFVRFQRQRSHARRIPNAVHQHHDGLEGPQYVPGQARDHRWRIPG